MQRDQVNDINVSALLGPAVRTADANGVVDRKGYATLALLVALGVEGVTLSGTDKIEVVITHSDDNSVFAAVAAADIVMPSNKPTGAQAPDASGIVFVADANADIPATFLVGYRGSKRYVKAAFDYSGTHGTGTPDAVFALLGEPQFAPAA